jgi:hypothetical protein
MSLRRLAVAPREAKAIAMVREGRRRHVVAAMFGLSLF